MGSALSGFCKKKYVDGRGGGDDDGAMVTSDAWCFGELFNVSHDVIYPSWGLWMLDTVNRSLCVGTSISCCLFATSKLTSNQIHSFPELWTSKALLCGRDLMIISVHFVTIIIIIIIKTP